AALVLVSGAARAQLGPGGYGTSSPLPKDARSNPKLGIKRSTASGVVKAVDADKKQVILTTGKDRKVRDMPIDVGPCVIKAGKGSAKFDDIHPGDRMSVYGEVTVQGGLRAMEITLPASRMSIPPPSHKKQSKAD